MQKFVKAGLVAITGLTMTVAGAPVTANAAKTKVLSTHKIAKKAVHGRNGNIYSGVKLSKVSHKLKNYKYTTFYATKKAVVKKHGKKAHVTYIKSGSKKGWVYSKYLVNGKAPFNKAKQMKKEISTANRYVMKGSSGFQDQVRGADNYHDLGNNIDNLQYDMSSELGRSAKDAQRDRTALLGIYDTFKGHFKGVEGDNLAKMAKQYENMTILEDDDDQVISTAETFCASLGDAIYDI